ncbi:GIY-YIG nuclease family protein [Massilia sp. LjRoot122]|uniref:GIY-YIG nuclease family protein n=1 Tax=Massilia sp. LjRoot122 TaxID=3342257 RepID=UPI003ECE0946
MKQTQFYALLEDRGISPALQPVTMMRHQDPRYPLYKYIGTKALTLYQALQKHRHEPGGLIFGFYGHRPGHALLLGVWRVMACMAAAEAYRQGRLEDSFEPADESWPGYFLELEETQLLADVRMKLEVGWGNDRVWRRVLKPADNYPVTVRSDPAVPFESLSQASVMWSELRVALQDVAWKQGLGSVSGVYLITDERSGHHYVGSANGAKGILRRWNDYACTGHGGNIQLVNLLQSFPGRENELRFTLLEAMPLATPKAQVIAREGYWKIALGSRTFGLNSN